MILTNLEGMVAKYAFCFKFEALHNEVEYEVLVTGFKIAKELEVKHLKVYNDLQLIIDQV